MNSADHARLRKWVNQLARAGWTVVLDRKNHYRALCPDGKHTLPLTPRNFRALHRQFQKLGVTLKN